MKVRALVFNGLLGVTELDHLPNPYDYKEGVQCYILDYPAWREVTSVRTSKWWAAIAEDQVKPKNKLALLVYE